jgi:hypothetical protein
LAPRVARFSPDGKTLTITFRQESQGNLESNTAIYRKQ